MRRRHPVMPLPTETAPKSDWRADRMTPTERFRHKHTEHKCRACGDTVWLAEAQVRVVVCRDCAMGATG